MSTQPSTDDILSRASKIKLLALDVDGVLTDGKLYFSNSGDEMKSFSTLDGQGIKLLQNSGVKVALITARESSLVSKRAKNLGIEIVVQGCTNKLGALKKIIGELDLSLDESAYMGDDLPDLSCINHVALGVTVPNAHASIKESAFCATSLSGGMGAVREVCDWILKAQGNYETAINQFR